MIPDSAAAGSLNPLAVLESAGRALPGGQSESAGSALSTPVTILLLLTIISLAPAIVLMTTCFPRILIVLGLLKQAIGAQGIPPPQIITALGIFLTLIVMAPTYDRVYKEAIGPWSRGEIRDMDVLWAKTRQPVRDFMFEQIESAGNWNSLYMIMEYRGIDTSEPEKLTRADADMVSLIPAFMISELKSAFLLGFRIYLPFLVIDMVISSMLISMSMMMLPPVLISLPFKLLLFVMVDGWQLVVGGLLRSFGSAGLAGVGS
ncbi:MAG: flagellar type III secretion system pore protein FliP [Planctomycetes bacterium]|nr:flagellar type III secretion system pore protein FliP [Planctomycetota bacterium]